MIFGDELMCRSAEFGQNSTGSSDGQELGLSICEGVLARGDGRFQRGLQVYGHSQGNANFLVVSNI